MRTIRLHVDVPLADTVQLVLPATAAHHAIRVLHLAVGQPLALFNGDGFDYAATLARVTGAIVDVSLHGRHAVNAEPPWPVTLAQCLARGDKMDFIVQKATELGATRIVPLVSERSGVRLDAARADKRVAHWRAVATSACEQCGRARVPAIEAPQAIDAWFAGVAADAALHLALSPAAAQRIRDLQVPSTGIVLVVGPEGGLGARDTRALDAAGFTGVALGPRILRTETAGLAALAAIQACHGDG